METELPIYKDPNYGIEFIVDVDRLALYEKANPENYYTLEDMRDFDEDGYSFEHYDRERRETLSIDLPQFVKLAPEQMANKYNKSVEEILLSTDFEIMVDHEFLTRRIKQGTLTTVEIAGHTFYADARIDLLRPKDDFSTMGISFDELDSYHLEERDVYAFPYDPKKHTIAELDWDKIVEYPKDILFVELPKVRTLDPVGWNRRYGFEETYGLKETGLRLEFKAEVVPWNKSGIDELITHNKAKLPKEALHSKPDPPRKGRGRKL
ncbi:hypothetical protein [Chryseobacterium culicis]|uniref:hypothetical protein n=1 Tax=Chryseobacterium culicis TaxID=680127 RepID=UPI00289EF4DB|nr:hypothetical protein [Chryseobacterium culicis]